MRALAADTTERFTFFCGGSRNAGRFLDVFDGVFVLQVDADTLRRRLARRPADEFGHHPAEQEFILTLHALGTDVPRDGERVDATAPLPEVVDSLLARAEQIAAVQDQRVFGVRSAAADRPNRTGHDQQ